MYPDTNAANQIKSRKKVAHYLCPKDYSGTDPTHGRFGARCMIRMQRHQKSQTRADLRSGPNACGRHHIVLAP